MNTNTNANINTNTNTNANDDVVLLGPYPRGLL